MKQLSCPSQHLFAYTDVSTGYQETVTGNSSTGDTLTLTSSPTIKPCLEIVSAGMATQGAAVQSWADPNIILNVFEMSSPNLEDTALPIDVTVQATGQTPLFYYIIIIYYYLAR